MKRAKIALNGRFSGTLQPTGTQTVAFYLFDSIVKSSRDFDLVIFADPKFKGVSDWAKYPQTEIRTVPFTDWARTKSQLWEQVALPLEVKRNRCCLVHHPIMTCPRFGLGTRTIVTLHDLTFYHHKEWVTPKFRNWLMSTAVPGMRKATHVVAISDYVLADGRKTLGLAEDRISRIYNGIGKFDASTPHGPQTGSVILGVNLWQPHKNLSRLLEAFKILRGKIPGVELHLAGRPQANYINSPELAESLKTPGVRILGYLSNDELARAYAETAVVCYPSLEEGFGLPILEAMSAGAPVVTSNVSCLPEIAGGAAILVDPYSPEDIAHGLYKALLEDNVERNSRITFGKKVASRFTWSEAAQQYIDLYQRLLA